MFRHIRKGLAIAEGGFHFFAFAFFKISAPPENSFCGDPQAGFKFSPPRENSFTGELDAGHKSEQAGSGVIIVAMSLEMVQAWRL